MDSIELRSLRPGLAARPAQPPPKGRGSDPYPPAEGSKLKPRNPKTDQRVQLQQLQAQ